MKNIKTNSKYLKKHDLFLPTSRVIEKEYLKDALKKKASAIISDNSINLKADTYPKLDIPIIKVPDRYKTLYQIYNDYYNDPFKNCFLIGVTGTDGKTSTALMIKNLLNNFIKTSYLGTNGFAIDKLKETTKNTTPSIDEILRYGALTKEKDGQALAMEVSSEGLLNKRCEGLSFDVAIFTNIKSDHLNVHKTWKNYLECKKLLFVKRKKNGYSILNKDDQHFKEFKKVNKRNIITYGKKNATYTFSKVRIVDNRTIFNLKHRGKSYLVNSPYLGLFNVYNLVAAIATVHLYVPSLPLIIKACASLPVIEGRMQFLDFKQPFKIVLDYAHTVQATKVVMDLARKIAKNKIIVVVGCAGGRYKEKRKEIGKIVSYQADIAIFTMDDPRFEDLNSIFKQMTCEAKNNVILISSRKKAIHKALEMAGKDDLVLVLGKGCDSYMAYQDKLIPYSDYEVIKNYCKRFKQ